MIPETGTRNEIKAACIHICTTPAIGEVYEWVIGQITDFWYVVKVNRYHDVHVKVFVSYYEGSCYEKTGHSTVVSRNDWRISVQDRILVYRPAGLPRIVKEMLMD